MAYFFSADAHFDHCNILAYTGRPFKDPSNSECPTRTRCNGCSSIPICLKNMNEALVTNWNSVVKPEDTVYHVGDFAFHWLHEGFSNSAAYWESRLNGKIVHIKGNHDRFSNGVDTPFLKALMNLGKYKILVQHKPPTMEIEIQNLDIDFVICGHVHNNWKHIFLGDKMILNVGVDVWDYHPVQLEKIINYYEKQT